MKSTASAVLDPVLGEGPPDPGPPPSDGEGSRHPREPSFDPPVSNAGIGMLAFILFESMLFAGLLGGFVLLRWGSAVWPPAGQPYFPIAVTWINTAILLGSCLPLFWARRVVAPRRNREPGMEARSGVRRPRHPRSSGVRGLALATGLGTAFLVIQGVEWVRLLAHGLTVQKGVYGASFLLLIGTHGLHVLGAVVWLGTITVLAAAGRLRPNGSALDLAAMYWSFVCVVWIVLFGMVYLA